ncbi:MAG: hypothetical protein AMXMBFR64_41590 [Myxococcales bacterium]
MEWAAVLSAAQRAAWGALVRQARSGSAAPPEGLELEELVQTVFAVAQAKGILVAEELPDGSANVTFSPGGNALAPCLVPLGNGDLEGWRDAVLRVDAAGADQSPPRGVSGSEPGAATDLGLFAPDHARGVWDAVYALEGERKSGRIRRIALVDRDTQCLGAVAWATPAQVQDLQDGAGGVDPQLTLASANLARVLFQAALDWHLLRFATTTSGEAILPAPGEEALLETLGSIVEGARCEEALSKALLLALESLAERPTPRPAPH